VTTDTANRLVALSDLDERGVVAVVEHARHGALAVRISDGRPVRGVQRLPPPVRTTGRRARD
jgi:hypothetical protein